jgi:hypothetical protein
MKLEPEYLAEFFRTRKIGFGRCLEPTMQCDEPAIRAHSIQNRQTITLLEQDNHVLAWQPRLSVAPITPAALQFADRPRAARHRPRRPGCQRAIVPSTGRWSSLWLRSATGNA